PDGLAFVKPATLTVTLPGGVDASQAVAFGFDGAGVDFHLVPSHTWWDGQLPGLALQWRRRGLGDSGAARDDARLHADDDQPAGGEPDGDRAQPARAARAGARDRARELVRPERPAAPARRVGSGRRHVRAGDRRVAGLAR